MVSAGKSAGAPERGKRGEEGRASLAGQTKAAELRVRINLYWAERYVKGSMPVPGCESSKCCWGSDCPAGGATSCSVLPCWPGNMPCRRKRRLGGLPMTNLTVQGKQVGPVPTPEVASESLYPALRWPLRALNTDGDLACTSALWDSATEDWPGSYGHK